MDRSSEQLAEFRAWFVAFDAQTFDTAIARDVEAGKLDQFAGALTRYNWLRRIPIRQYPYLVFYEVMDDCARVLAVRHGARNPSSMPGGENP